MGYKYEYLPETGEIVDTTTGEKWLADEAHVEMWARIEGHAKEIEDLYNRAHRVL